MKFGSRPVQECEGAILAHTLRLESGSIRKGHVLTRNDLERIAAAGHPEIVVAALEKGDIGENEAADRVARLLAGAHVAPAPAATGRCNLIARSSGVLLLDADEINRLNSVCETVTVATLPPFTPIGKGDAVATIKIIPYAIAGSVMDRVSRGARPALEVRPYVEVRCGLVITQVAGGRASLADKAAHALQARLERVGLSVADEIRCPHEEEAVADAIGSLAARGCAPIFIFGAAAACDRGDVVPAAIERSGGRVLHFGMPVEPGNLLVLGERAGASVIGMPSCARSLAPNGFDWVLNRILAGIPVTGADIMAMGVGGLITGRAEAAKKRRPVLPEQHSDRFVTTPPRIAAVVLAAGRSRRMGDVNKLTRPLAGKAMLRHVAEAALASQASPVIVVTGHQEESVRAALEGLEVTFVHAADAAAGMSRSLTAGIAAVPEDADGAVVCLGDMPLVKAEHIDRLIAQFDPQGDAAICVAAYRGQRGNPVLLGREFFPDLMALEGDRGARELIAAQQDRVMAVEMNDPGVLKDYDTPADFAG